jgi:hypothetical protein
MKAHVFSRRVLQNQEVFESGKCLTYKDIPTLSNVIIFTKNKRTFTEEELLLKISFLQLLFDKKVFLVVGFKHNQTLKRIPVGGFVTIRKNLVFFLDFFFHTFVKEKENFFLIKSKFYVFRFLFKEKKISLRHFFRYSLYLFKHNF